jgi:hypothetical protein
LFILTIKLPNFRFWPPPKPRSWQFFTAWLIASIVIMNILLLGLFDFDSFVLPHLKQRLPFAIGFLVIGAAIGTWAWSTFANDKRHESLAVPLDLQRRLDRTCTHQYRTGPAAPQDAGGT